MRLCLYCHAPVTFENEFWRYNSEDPADGQGGDATCPVRTGDDGPSLGHVPGIERDRVKM